MNDEFKLTSEHANPGQGSMFDDQEPAPEGKHRAELLVYLATRGGFAMVSDFLESLNFEVITTGACIKCWAPRRMVDHGPGTRAYCQDCYTHTVCRALDIEANNIPGFVSPKPE